MLSHSSHPSPHAIVLIHGAGENSSLWGRTMQRLDGPSTALAVDLPGHPSGEITCKTIRDYSEAVHDFIRSRDLRGCVACGHSMGGGIALDLTLNHPQDIGGLVLVSTGAKLGVDQRILGGLREDPLRTIEQVITPWSYHTLDVGLARESRAALSVLNPPIFLNDYLACAVFDLRDRIQRISARTVVVCGDKDRMTPPKWSHFLKENIPGAEAYFVKDSGHMLPLEKPEALGQVLQSFLIEFSR